MFLRLLCKMAHKLIFLPSTLLRSDIAPRVRGTDPSPRAGSSPAGTMLRHLRQDGLPQADRVRSVPAVSDFLDTPRPMREIAEFRRLDRAGTGNRLSRGQLH
jgi:hypothetical protein